MPKTVFPALLLISMAAFAQQTKAPELTSTEKFAISSIMEKQAKISEETKALNQAAQAVVADIAVTHPGYHLDANTMQLVKDAPKAEQKAKP